MKNTILIVDDDTKLRALLCNFFSSNNYTAYAAKEGNEAIELIKNQKFDLIILDYMMPGKNGIEIMQIIKTQLLDKTPIIMLTAFADVDDRINGLESGAEDYIAKPFDPKELLLRVKNILKRENSEEQKCVFGDFVFNIKTSQLLDKNNSIIPLTTKESEILKLLASKPGETVLRHEFSELYTRSLDVTITRLRAKLGHDINNYIQTIRNKGYVLWGKLI